MIRNNIIRESCYYLIKETQGWKKWDLFYVAMGAYDGVELCELLGIFLLEKISEICNKWIIRNKSGTQLEKMKKKFERLSNEYNLDITVKSNQKMLN